jgi:hypothetical protein
VNFNEFISRVQEPTAIVDRKHKEKTQIKVLINKKPFVSVVLVTISGKYKTILIVLNAKIYLYVPKFDLLLVVSSWVGFFFCI